MVVPVWCSVVEWSWRLQDSSSSSQHFELNSLQKLSGNLQPLCFHLLCSRQRSATVYLFILRGSSFSDRPSCWTKSTCSLPKPVGGGLNSDMGTKKAHVEAEAIRIKAGRNRNRHIATKPKTKGLGHFLKTYAHLFFGGQAETLSPTDQLPPQLDLRKLVLFLTRTI